MFIIYFISTKLKHTNWACMMSNNLWCSNNWYTSWLRSLFLKDQVKLFIHMSVDETDQLFHRITWWWIWKLHLRIYIIVNDGWKYQNKRCSFWISWMIFIVDMWCKSHCYMDDSIILVKWIRHAFIIGNNFHWNSID